MSEKHRNLDLPEVIQEGKWFYIADEFGLFEAYSRDAVISLWKNKVDVVKTQELVEEGLIQRVSEDAYSCLRCGAVLYDPLLHKFPREQ